MANLDFDLGVLERQLHQARQNAIQAELAAAGLQEIGHPMLLCVLGITGEHRPGTPVRTQRELARLLHVSPAAVTTSLKSLERKGYILREPGDGDARCNRVLLTEKGQQAVDDCLACLRRVSRRMYAGLTNEEQAVMRSFYLRMLDNLQPDQGAAHSSK